jgi:hypothetical protein
LNNLQKIEAILLVKDNIVPAIPYCPTHHRYANANSSNISIPLSQLPNILVIFTGGGVLKVKWIIRQIMRAKKTRDK